MNKVNIIAECCQNHNGNKEILKKMIHTAAENGADYVKIQAIRSKDLSFRERFEKGKVDETGKVLVIKRPYEQELERLAKLDLSHVSQLPVRNFSSGMTKRLMIGRLMLCKPEILILDEPYTGLDQNSFRWFQEYLREFHQQGGTVLMVTHQIELGLELATRVLVLHRKKIKHDISSAGLSVERCCALLEE